MAVIDITKENYEEEVIHSEGLVLVFCYKEKSRPCRKLVPVVEEVANEFEGQLKVVAVDCAKEKELSDEVFRAVSVPLVMLLKDGIVHNLTFDCYRKKQILMMLSQHIEGIEY